MLLSTHRVLRSSHSTDILLWCLCTQLQGPDLGSVLTRTAPHVTANNDVPYGHPPSPFGLALASHCPGDDLYTVLHWGSVLEARQVLLILISIILQ